MVSKTYITQNLKQIERLYSSAPTIQKSLFYSKLAVIELCGWIEMSMDDIALRLSSRHLREPDYIKLVKNKVTRTWGFDYENNFLPMIETTIGRHGIEQMNLKLDNSLILPFLAALTSLKTSRNSLAHQYIKGTTLIIDAPSVTVIRLSVVLAGLKNIEEVLLKR